MKGFYPLQMLTTVYFSHSINVFILCCMTRAVKTLRKYILCYKDKQQMGLEHYKGV